MQSGGFLEFEFGGVAEGIEDAEEEIGGNVFRVAVHYGGEAGAGSTRQPGDLSVSEALALNDFDNFRVEIAAKGDFRSVGGGEAESFGELGGGACDCDFRLLHGATPLAASFLDPIRAAVWPGSFSQMRETPKYLAANGRNRTCDKFQSG